MGHDEELASSALPVTVADLQAAIARAHEQNSLTEIEWPDDLGRFPDASLLPWIFPVAVDANALRDEILRVGKPRTILANAASQGVLRLDRAPHVIDEVFDHYIEWATDRGVPAASVWQRWQSTYLPLLRCVDVPAGLTEGEQSARITFLATSTTRYGDPDDVPIATLAILMAAPLLSRDKAPLRAVYGDGFDHVAHAKWIDKLRAGGGDLGAISSYLHAATALAAGVGIGSYYGVKSLVARIGWPMAIAVTLAGAAAFSLLVPVENKRSSSRLSGRFSGLDVLPAELPRQSAGWASFAPPQRPRSNRCHQRHPTGHSSRRRLAATRRSPEPAYTLSRVAPEARSAPSNLVTSCADDYPARLAGRPRFARRQLRSSPAFDQPTPGRLQLGKARVRRGC